MRAIFPLVLVLCWIGAPAAADIACGTVQALTRLHAGQGTMERAAESANPSSALGPLVRDIRRLDGDMIEFSRQTDLNASDRVALRNLADIANRFARLADRRDTAGLRALMNSSQTEEVFNRATAVLARVGCPAGTFGDGIGSPATNDTRIGTRAATEMPEQLSGSNTLTLTQSVIMLVAGVLLAALATTAFWLRKRQIERKRRRAQRYPLNRPSGFYYLGENRQGRLQDISAVGVKIGHDGCLKGAVGAKVTLALAGWPRDAEVVWANQHFAGLQFHKPLSRSRLHSFIALGNDAVGEAADAA